TIAIGHQLPAAVGDERAEQHEHQRELGVGWLRIRPGLTPLAAAGLALVAIGGTVYQIAAGEPGNAVFALVFVLLCAFIAYGRWQLVPYRDRSRGPALQPARQV